LATLKSDSAIQVNWDSENLQLQKEEGGREKERERERVSLV
jgi:hypothetical protein